MKNVFAELWRRVTDVQQRGAHLAADTCAESTCGARGPRVKRPVFTTAAGKYTFSAHWHVTVAIGKNVFAELWRRVTDVQQRGAHGWPIHGSLGG